MKNLDISEIYAGIDYSINSPALCVWNPLDNTWIFTAFINDKERHDYSKHSNRKIFRHYKAIEKLSEKNKDIFFCCYNGGYHDEDFIKENQKMANAGRELSILILKTLFEISTKINPGFTKVNIALEGASFQSKERNSTDLNMFNGMLRSAIAQTYGCESLYVFPPSSVKKTAGKGNFNKGQMIDAFLGKEKLKGNPLYEYIRDNYTAADKYIKPIDDLADSFWLVETLKEYLAK